MNGGETPCRKRSRCWPCSCRTCAEAEGEGTGRTGGGQSLRSTGKGSTAASAWGPRPGSTSLE